MTIYECENSGYMVLSLFLCLSKESMMLLQDSVGLYYVGRGQS